MPSTKKGSSNRGNTFDSLDLRLNISLPAIVQRQFPHLNARDIEVLRRKVRECLDRWRQVAPNEFLDIHTFTETVGQCARTIWGQPHAKNAATANLVDELRQEDTWSVALSKKNLRLLAKSQRNAPEKEPKDRLAATQLGPGARARSSSAQRSTASSVGGTRYSGTDGGVSRHPSARRDFRGQQTSNAVRNLSHGLCQSLRWQITKLTFHGWFDIDDFELHNHTHGLHTPLTKGVGRNPATWRDMIMYSLKRRFLVMWHPTAESLKMFREMIGKQSILPTSANAPFHVLIPDFTRKPKAIKVTHGYGEKQVAANARNNNLGHITPSCRLISETGCRSFCVTDALAGCSRHPRTR